MTEKKMNWLLILLPAVVLTDPLAILKYLSPAMQPEQQRLVVPYHISGTGQLSARQLASFLLAGNPSLSPADTGSLAELYIREAAIEGINHDIAFAQMLLETGFQKYGGVVRREQYNYAGLGAINSSKPGSHFSAPRWGVRAHIQHLKAYTSHTRLNRDCVDLRFHLVKRGSAQTIFDLAGSWAMDPDYGKKIENLLQRMYNFSLNM